ncbi:MAG: tetratricopeptide repeat protein [Bryobacteraceae bacterium]|nr:tetratricopeptide repeat protein [Bryobacteraceae bacterium]MDW8379291.1 tetratricopeptide repeat protein [Bryobacterales bacterium]
MRLAVSFLLLVLTALAASIPGLKRARDRQDRAALEKIVAELAAKAERASDDASAHYHLALAESYLAEVNLELKLRNEAKAAAEAGIRAAEKAVALQSGNAEYHRILGTLCGQVIPANVLAGIRYGKCALEHVNKAIELNPKSWEAHLSRGVGNYYLPPSFGGGVGLAIKDFQKAIELNSRSADAYLWLGVAYRKTNQFAEARKALEKSLELNPDRLWAKELLEKTPRE